MSITVIRQNCRITQRSAATHTELGDTSSTMTLTEAAIALRDHLRRLADANAPIEAFPDRDEIIRRCHAQDD